MERCPWSDLDDTYRAYHDLEWGVPVRDDLTHFEFLLLETMQAGLSWRLILSKRENYRKAFDSFDWKKVMRYTPGKVESLLSNPGIIRNALKIKAAVKNANAFEAVRSEFGSFDSYIWSFTGRPVVNSWKNQSDIPTTSPLSDEVSKDMKKRGFSFVGSVTIYSHLQAIGVVNDHLISCPRRNEITALYKSLGFPK